MADRRTDADLVELLKLHKKFNTTKTARELGLSTRSVREAVSSAKARGLTADTPTTNPLAEAKVQNKILQRQISKLQNKEDTAKSIRTEIYNMAAHTPKAPKWLTRVTKRGPSNGCWMTNWSDWHHSEVVRLEETGGTNEFNSKISRERIARLVERTIQLAKGFQFKGKGVPVKHPGIVVNLGGDMISGNIHEELAESNDQHPLQAVNDLVDLITGGIERLAGVFGQVFVPCVVGNHGRTTTKPRMKGKIFENYEWNLYCQIERHFRGDKRVTVHVANETDVYYEVFNTKFLLTHGDCMGSAGGDGIIGAIGPITRGMIKLMRSYDAIGKPIDCVIIGHWHQKLLLPFGIVNNSFKGDDEYARLKMRALHSRPSQNMWYVDELQGITQHIEVFVDEEPTFEKRASWVNLPSLVL